MELEQIKQAIKQGYPDGALPKIGMVVVKKRISTRLFQEAGGRFQNPPPGLVVDSVVTRPEWWDFFLVSQAVRQGTVSPTHYNIIEDNTGFQPCSADNNGHIRHVPWVHKTSKINSPDREVTKLIRLHMNSHNR